MALPFSRSPMTRIGGGPLFPNMNIRPVPQAPTGFGGLSSQPGYGGSSWNYGGQSYAIPTNQSVTPGGATFAAPARAAAASPLSLNLTQAANRQVNQILNPQLAAQAAYGRQQNAAIQGFAQALMGKLQPIAGQVGADYDQAISQTGALANQAASFLQQANPTPQVQALLQSAGAPAEQQAQIGGQLGQTFGGGAGVLSFLGGAVPGREMAADKAAAQTQAAQYPLLAALRGQQDLAGALGQQATARNQILATRGQLYSDARQQIIENNMNRAKERQQEKSDAATAAYHGQLLQQGAAKLKQAGQIAGAKLDQSGKIAAGKRTDAWNLGVLKANETSRYHDQTTKSRDFATKVRNRAITVGAQSKADANTTRVVHNAATELQNSIDSINTKEYHDTMAALTEMGLTGIDPKTGKPTPKFQADLDKIHADAQAKRTAAAQGWAKITETATHHKATETTAATNAATAATRANKPQIVGSSTTGYYAVYPDGTRKQVVAASPTARKPTIVGSDKSGRWIVNTGPGGKTTKTLLIPPVKGGGAGGLSPASTAAARRSAGKAMDLWYYGDEKKGISAIDYPKAVRLAMHQFSLSREDATALANDFYAPGEGGRPLGSKSWESAIAKGTAAGPPKPGAGG